MRKKSRPIPFQTVIYRLIALGLLPAIILAIVMGFNSVSTSNRLIAQSHQRYTEQRASQLDDQLLTIRTYLDNLVFDNTNFSNMGVGDTSSAVYFAMTDLASQMRIAVSSFSYLSGICFISNDDGLWADRFSDDISAYSTRATIRSVAKSALTELSGYQRYSWSSTSIDSNGYLTYVVGLRGAYIFAIIDLDNLTDTGDELSKMIFSDSESMTPLTDADWISLEGITLEDTDSYIYVGDNQRYMMIDASLGEADVYLFLLVSDGGFYSSATLLQKLLLLLAILSISLIAWFQNDITNRIGKPLERLSIAMKHVEEGHLDETISDEFSTQEFCDVRDSFNAMVGQIKHLKIEAYEQELARDKVEMQYLHFQIRPHFLLNCLKGIYASAQQNRTDRVQQEVILVSRMMRYMFRDVNVTVPFCDELKYVMDYMEVQRLSLPVPPEISFDGDEGLLACDLPPFSVSTFVENAFKHRRDTSAPLHIFVKYLKLQDQDGDYLDITVRNDGGAFSDDALEALNKANPEVHETTQIGLNNIAHRLLLIYGGRATLAFYNEDQTAVAEMIIPLEKKEVPEDT